jgi:hypothetical protein
MTITAWVKTSDLTQSSQTILGEDSGGVNAGDFFFGYDNEVADKWTMEVVKTTGGTANVIVQSDSNATTDWTHLATTLDGSKLRLYVNGILQSDNETFVDNIFITANDIVIGSHRSTLNNTNFKGNISQVGIWRGALTQAQIQSVMESTSYDKIPADVKSTLGANTLGTPTSSTSEVGWDASAKVLTFTENRFAFWDNGVTANSTLYKIQYEILTRTAGGLAEGGGSSAFSLGTVSDSVGSHTIYAVSRADATGAGNNNDYFQLQSNGFRGTIGNISIKEVTNDIVAYYPLDSSENGVTQDITTGETLSSEKFGFASDDWNNFGSSLISQSGGTISYTGSGVDNASINYEGNTFGSFAFETGKLYKLVFTISSATQGRFKMQTSGNATIFLHSTNYSSGTYTFYIPALSSYNGQGITLRGEYTGGNFDITSISWKEVTSNTGVLN